MILLAIHRHALQTLRPLEEVTPLLCLQAGALELDSSELTFETTAQGHSRAIAKEVVPMMGIVAEMMIWANQTVAEKLVGSFDRVALVRRHPPPPPDALGEVLSRSLCFPS